MPTWLSWLFDALVRIGQAIWDRVRSEQNAREAAEAAERERALKEAQRQEAEARDAADQPSPDDEKWFRD